MTYNNSNITVLGRGIKMKYIILIITVIVSIVIIIWVLWNYFGIQTISSENKLYQYILTGNKEQYVDLSISVYDDSQNLQLPNISMVYDPRIISLTDARTCKQMEKDVNFDKFAQYQCAAQLVNDKFQLITPFDTCTDIYMNSANKSLNPTIQYKQQQLYDISKWPTCDQLGFYLNYNKM